MHYKHITINEREKIALLLAAGKKQVEIARELNRHKSTISREIQRNKGKTGYLLLKAQRKSDKRRSESKQPYRMNEPAIKEYVENKLRLYWSPEQIASSLRLSYPKKTKIHISRQAIYD